MTSAGKYPTDLLGLTTRTEDKGDRHVHSHQPPDTWRACRRDCRARLRAGRGEPLLVAPLRHGRGALRELHRGDRNHRQPDRGHGRRASRPDRGRGRQQPRRRLHHRRHLAPCPREGQGRVPAGRVGGARGAHPELPAGCGQPMVRRLAARAHLLLRQDRRDRPAAHLRRSRRSEVQGPDLHALGHQRLQPDAARLGHRQRGRGGRAGLGAGAARQPRA